MRSLVYYVSGHGFGHAVRSAEIIRALLRRESSLSVHVRGTSPDWLFPPAVSRSAAQLDVGVVQQDALRIDEQATLERAAELAASAEHLVGQETELLGRVQAGLVVADVPPIPFLAARRAGLASVAVTNFSWDWIYAPYVAARPDLGWLPGWLRQAYGQADLLLRLPLFGDLSAFRLIEDVPLVSRPPSLSRLQVRARLGLDPDATVVLLSFGGLGLLGFDPEVLRGLAEYTFVASELEIDPRARRPRNVALVPAQNENYVNLIAASDVVVSKPGFGIVANCLAERVPLVYTDRGQFAEYDVLVAGLQRHGRSAHVSQAELLAGELGPALNSMLDKSAPWPPAPRTDGAAVIADRLLALLASS